jgi:hypothetical protein
MDLLLILITIRSTQGEALLINQVLERGLQVFPFLARAMFLTIGMAFIIPHSPERK